MVIGSCPVANAIGATSSGKSTSLNLISKLLGLHRVSQSSSEYVVTELTKTTVPLSWDDPTLPSLVTRPLMCVFNGLGNQTHERGHEEPQTTFLLTVNFTLTNDMR